MTIQSFRDLKEWERGMDLAVECCRMSRRLPRDETFGLAIQLRRSAISIPANVAEGHGRVHRGDFVDHLSIARGSLAEVETHLLLAQRLAYVRTSHLTALFALVETEGRLLNALLNALNRSQPRRSAKGGRP